MKLNRAFPRRRKRAVFSFHPANVLPWRVERESFPIFRALFHSPSLPPFLPGAGNLFVIEKRIARRNATQINEISPNFLIAITTIACRGRNGTPRKRCYVSCERKGSLRFTFAGGTRNTSNCISGGLRKRSAVPPPTLVFAFPFPPQ